MISEQLDDDELTSDLSDRPEEKGPVKPSGEDEEAGQQQSSTAAEDSVLSGSHASRNYARSLSHISESSADGVVLTDRSANESGEVMSLVSGLSINDIEMEMPCRTPESPGSEQSPSRLAAAEEEEESMGQCQNGTKEETCTSPSPRTEGADLEAPGQTDAEPQLECNVLPVSGDVMYVARRVTVDEETPAPPLEERPTGPVDSGLEDALAAVVSSLDDYRGQFPELQLLEQELRLLQVTLKVSPVRLKLNQPL